MFRAIGTVIILVAISHLLNDAFNSFESATVALFETVETAATVSTEQLERVSAMQNES